VLWLGALNLICGIAVLPLAVGRGQEERRLRCGERPIGMIVSLGSFPNEIPIGFSNVLGWLGTAGLGILRCRIPYTFRIHSVVHPRFHPGATQEEKGKNASPEDTSCEQ
jgi:hypothetical protein